VVALFVRLKLTLLARSFRRSGAAAFGMVLAYLFALGMTLPAVVGLVFLRQGDPATVAAITVPLLAFLTVCWLLLPLVFFGVDETLDPARFALLPVRARQMVPGLVAGSFIGAPGLALVLIGLGLVVAWSGTAAGLVGALIAVPLGAVTCILVSRALTTALAGALGRRRAKENVAALVAFAGMFIGLGMQAVGRLISGWVAAAEDPAAGVRGVADIVGWTPFGWAWAVPGDLAQGRYGVAAARLLLAALLAYGLSAWWRWSLDRALVMPPGGQGDAEKVHSSALVERVFGTSPRGAIAGRIVRSWRRDSRAMVQVAALAVIPVLMVAPVFIGAGQEGSAEALPMLLSTGPFIAVMAGMVVANSLVLDGTAVALHALTGVAGSADRWGRALAYLLLVAPVTGVVWVTSVAINHRWDLAPALFSSACPAGPSSRCTTRSSTRRSATSSCATSRAPATWPRATPTPPASPGVAMVTSGPGATNIVTPLCRRLHGLGPDGRITGQVPTAAIGTDAFQECDITSASPSRSPSTTSWSPRPRTSRWPSARRSTSPPPAAPARCWSTSPRTSSTPPTPTRPWSGTGPPTPRSRPACPATSPPPRATPARSRRRPS
jgi:ABC-2 type transport system permease protein